MKRVLLNGRWVRPIKPPKAPRPTGYTGVTHKSINLRKCLRLDRAPFIVDNNSQSAYAPEALRSNYGSPLEWLIAWETVERRESEE